MRRLAAIPVLALALASMGQRCDPNRACPTGSQPALGASVPDILDALRAGKIMEAELCECRDGFERIDEANWLRGCRPIAVATPAPTAQATPEPIVAPTAKPTPEEPSPTPLPLPTASPTPTPTPSPTSCVDTGGWWADGVTDDRNGCGPTGMHACWPTKARACRAWIEARDLEWVMGGGRRWYAWGDMPDPQYAWVSDTCDRHRNPNGPKFAGADGIGVERTPGFEEPCPEETFQPTPAPSGDCSSPVTWIKLVAHCGELNKPCCSTGQDWCRPPIFPYLEDWEGLNAFLSATYMNAEGEVHRPNPDRPSPIDACYPGEPPASSWQQHNPDDQKFDMRGPWSNGHNWTINNIHAFRTTNPITIDAYGLHGETRVVVR